MTLHEFDMRMVEEQQMFFGMCDEIGVYENPPFDVRATLAHAFAEGLILDMSVDAALARIESDPEGAAAMVVVIKAIYRSEKLRKLYAADLPSTGLTPFYISSAFVLDVPMSDLAKAEKIHLAMCARARKKKGKKAGKKRRRS